MKLRILPGLAALTLGLTAVIAAPQKADALGWCGTNSSGADVCIKQTGTSTYEVLVDDKYNDTGFIAFMDCAAMTVRWRAAEGYSRSDMKNELRKFCTVVNG